MRGMVRCNGCGFNVEEEQVRPVGSQVGGTPCVPERQCSECIYCVAEPKMRESYRRGFNAGMNAMADAASYAVAHVMRWYLGRARSRLRRPG